MRSGQKMVLKKEETKMKNMKKIVVVGVMALALGAQSMVALASEAYKTPADAAAGVTGQSLEKVMAQRYDEDKTYGTIAREAGAQEAFQVEMQRMRESRIAEKVAAGLITQEEADAFLARIASHQADCDGTGSQERLGQSMGLGMGGQKGQGRGAGQGQGQRMGARQGA